MSVEAGAIPAPVARAAVGGAVSARVTEDFADLPSLGPQWEALFRRGPNEPSTSFEWTAAMARHHHRPGDRRFLVRLERSGTIIGVVPLVLRTFKVMGWPIALLAPLSETYNTHSDLLLESPDDEIVQAVVSALFALDAEWDCFRMARLLETNPLLPVLHRTLQTGNHSHAVREGLAAYVLDLPGSYDAYLASRSAKFRNHLKRMERKLAGRGRVEVHELSHGDAFDEAFGVLLQVERASWKHAHGSSVTAVDRQSAFYRDFGREALGAGRLHLHWLSLDSRPLAYNLGYLTPAGYHYLKTSYDHEYRPFGPATVLRARLIESLIARGTSRLDFPGEPYAWEAQWTGTLRRRVVLSVYRPTVRGRLLALADRIRYSRPADDTVAHVDPRAQRRRLEAV